MSTTTLRTTGAPASYVNQDPSRRLKGIVVVVALHAFLGYALISGMARNALTYIKKPLEAVVIQEVIIPPPPPPPPPPKPIEAPKQTPKVEAPPPPFVPPSEVASPVNSTAPAIASVATPPPAAAVIEPPPAPPAPKPAPPGPVRASIGVACPTQVAPEMPRKALQDGIEGVVKAQATIRDGVVKDVTIISGPRVFHAAVKTAMMQYKCVADSGEVIATQEFGFKIE